MKDCEWKILDLDIDFDIMKSFFQKNKYDNIISNKYIKIEAQNTPFSIIEREVSNTTILHKRNKIIINTIKPDRILSYWILLSECLSNYSLIEKIYINDNLINDNTTLQEYLNWTELNQTTIEIIFNKEESARLSTCYIYYLITPWKHDNYYFNKEYDRIKLEQSKVSTK